MDAFYERLIVRAATIDELLSDDFETLPDQKGVSDLASRRFVAWCQASASGDLSLFEQRLARDGWSTDEIRKRFTASRRKTSVPPPAWIADAAWIEAALQNPTRKVEHVSAESQVEVCAFEDLFTPLIKQATEILWSDVGRHASDNLTESARACLHNSLLKELSSLCAPAIYEQFSMARKTSAAALDALDSNHDSGTAIYGKFVADMKAGGFRRLFEEKPVLLRLIAIVSRQWIETSREFILRLSVDLPAIRRDILLSNSGGPVIKIEGDISDPHNGGRSVRIVSFADGSRVVYKPKDLRVDIAWFKLIERLNGADPPIDLRAVRAIAPDGYGWTEFIGHTGTDRQGFKRFFRRAGSWLALFHYFVASDMHQENLIASGDYPVPIDLETILQSAVEERESEDPESQAFNFATEKLANSVMMVGLLPAYGRSPENNVFAIGGMTADWSSKIKIKWNNINSDEMRPARAKEATDINSNLPHTDGRYGKFAEHIADFASGFEDYAKFLLRLSKDSSAIDIFDAFAGLPVRKVIRPTRFYSMLLQRLKNHRAMDDGIVWSAQADFMARLAEWDKDTDVLWPVQWAERSALLALNVPHFVSPSDDSEIRDATGFAVQSGETTGIIRARARAQRWDEDEIGWEIEVITENTKSLLKTANQAAGAPRALGEHVDSIALPTRKTFIVEADKIADELSRYAIRRGPGAAWIGIDWLGDAEVFQLVCLGSDLYNGASGISVFLAAHAAVTGLHSSADLARAGVVRLRKNLKSRNAARMARSMGVGGATGLGSVVYALAVMSKCLRDDTLLADAHAASELFTDGLIAADKQLDIIGGSAGAILCLLRLYQDSRSEDVLKRAIKCGEHLIAQTRLGPVGHRSWVGQGSGKQALNGMSHGAAGFAFALASLASATGREEFAKAAAECIAFENSSYDPVRTNWPDMRGEGQPYWPCQWCHGATGIGLARIAMAKRRVMDPEILVKDIRNAVEGAKKGWPAGVDTLCCGTLGSIEFFCEAGSALGRDDLRELASRRLAAVIETAASAGDYRWNSGKREFNLGLFRGLAGVGYTSLRQADGSLPDIMIWE
ncbi:MAG TPA: type 2 lanthipeptide synthetase LanM family protein [Pseudolabrys sp.]|nr:type 2 lanthipeptide synthetase LanM family protein [Pseudolabrys sp.]